MHKKASINKLLQTLRSFYKKGARAHLPWRKTHDPYRILVSEVMLQQTQVDRVVPFYTNFIKKYPTPQRLASAGLADVLKAWQGLGYNRRARFLHEAAKVIARDGWSEQKLPGVGPYTAAAIQAFAHNQPTVFIETNIRTVLFYHLFPSRLNLEEGSSREKGTSRFNLEVKVSDRELLPLVGELLRGSRMEPRDFYAALMDYGSHLKRQGVRLNNKSKHYAKQSKFEGSRRQKRAALLRKLLARGASEAELTKILHS